MLNKNSYYHDFFGIQIFLILTTILTMQLMLSPKVNGIIVLCTIKVFSVDENVVLFISLMVMWSVSGQFYFMIFSTWIECHIMCLFAHHIDNKGKVNIGALSHACSICMRISKTNFCVLDPNLMSVRSQKHKINLHSYFGDGFLCFRS